MKIEQPQYPSFESLYSTYKSPAKELIFEGREYEFMGKIECAGKEVSKHVYRDERERHTLVIHLVASTPYYIDAHYSIATADADLLALQKVQA